MKKKNIIIAVAFIALISLFPSCKKNISTQAPDAFGFLSFNGAISIDEAVDTKAATAASGNYSIFITDAEGATVLSTTYSDVKAKDNKLSLSAGTYTLEARSTAEAVPASAKEQPVYGISKSFTITAGETTEIGSLTCTLLQCKVTVSYSDDFLAMVTGNGSTTVTVTSGYPQTFDLTYASGAKSYDQSAAYFAVNNGESTSMEVVFKGLIDGKSQKMTKTFTGIQPKQWRQIKFIKKVAAEGTASFDITIDDLVDDAALNNSIDDIAENIIGDDPDAPKGDGGITLALDHTAGCDEEFTDLENLVIPQVSERDICLRLKCEVPNGVKKFTVDIASTNANFVTAVEAADAMNLDLINPTEDNMIIFSVVPFPYGADLAGKTSIDFDLSAAQDAILPYQGRHTFTMNITDAKGCKKAIPVVMVVE